MMHATFLIDDELSFFLPRRHRHRPIEHVVDRRASVKDMVESLGVPHSEIDVLVVNGRSVDFSYIVQPEDHVHVHARSIDLPDRIELRAPYPVRPRFILDIHLGRLASYLRMLGFDTLYRNDYPDDELAQVAHDECRILLTRDVGLLKRSLVTYGYYVRNTDPKKRIVEIMERFDLGEYLEPFKHCLKCNGLLRIAAKEEIKGRIRPDTAKYYDEFHLCLDCNQVYWKGSHYEKMVALLDALLQV